MFPDPRLAVVETDPEIVDERHEQFGVVLAQFPEGEQCLSPGRLVGVVEPLPKGVDGGAEHCRVLLATDVREVLGGGFADSPGLVETVPQQHVDGRLGSFLVDDADRTNARHGDVSVPGVFGREQLPQRLEFGIARPPVLESGDQFRHSLRRSSGLAKIVPHAS
ncbi:hypothetical protein [Haloarcula sp. CBA1131]|uniref:hypothetical protein n=1 Tax=Haloarcula sp. CBA1131 TaxID=1853686 RepID=UPI001783FA44|nr:hypothetical protein [Haloarcula sp. CBA1131]